MLNFLKKFKETEPSKVSLDEKNILTAAILIECAKEDGDFSDVEIEKIKKLLESKLGLNSEKVCSVFDQATELCQDSVEIYSLTKDIRDNFSHEEILDILEFPFYSKDGCSRNGGMKRTGWMNRNERE